MTVATTARNDRTQATTKSNDEIIRIFVGTDRSQMLGVKVLEFSIGKHTDHPFQVQPLLLDLPQPRNKLNAQRTGFSFSRFAVPKLAGYQGKAIYMDADMLVFRDIKGLWDIPFNGAKLLVQGAVPEHLLNKRRLARKGRRLKQISVCLFDCDALDWDVDEIIAGLDGKYSYHALMNDLCILKESDIGYSIPFQWNSLEYWDEATCNLHYTDMDIQPWVSPRNMLGHLWLNTLGEMLSSGVLSWSELEREIELGYVRPSIIHELKNNSGRNPTEKELSFLEGIDRKAKFRKHRKTIQAERKRKVAEVWYRCTRIFHRPLRSSAEEVSSDGQDFRQAEGTSANSEKNRSKQLSVLIVLDLIQDLEVMKPLIRSLAEDARVELKVLVSNWLNKNSKRVMAHLTSTGAEVSIFNETRLLRDHKLSFLDVFDCVLLPSESNLPPHRVSHHIANVAARRDTRTITFQHGLENIGLTYFDEKAVHIASKQIITWSDAPNREARIAPFIQEKCISLGMFKELTSVINTSDLRKALGRRRIIGVFENLHWERYSKQYKKEFLSSLECVAQSMRDVAFLVKPHHAGRWLNKHHRRLFKHLNNVLVIDVRDPLWEPYTGNQLVSACDAVITTPSTIAIDAALVRTPVAIVANDLVDLTHYEPLRFLSDCKDWINFINAVLNDPQHEALNVETFFRKSVREHNPIKMFTKEVLKLGDK